MPLITSRPFLVPPPQPGFAGTEVQTPAGGFPTGLGSSLDIFPGSNRYILAVRTASGTNNGVKAIAASVSGTTVTWAAAWHNVFTVAQCGGNLCRISVIGLDGSRAMVLWDETSTVKAQVIQIDTGTLAVTGSGTTVTLDSSATNFVSAELVDTDKVVVSWTNTTTGDPRNRSVVLTVSSLTITQGSTLSWSGGAFDTLLPAAHNTRTGFALDTSKVLMGGGSGAGNSKATAFTVTGTTLTNGTSLTFAAWGQKWEHGMARLDTSRGLHVYSDGNTTDRLRALILSVSGTTVSNGSSVLISANPVNTEGNIDIYFVDTDTVVVTYLDDVTGRQTIQTLTVSGTTVTPGVESDLSTISMVQGRLIPISTTQAFFTYRSGNYYGVVIDM